MTISIAEKKALLQLARRKILKRINPDLARAFSNPPVTDSLQIRCGAFVSLYVQGDLRGCIGTFSEEETLHKNVSNMALSSATTDTRFSPIKPGEAKELKIEIGVLSPRQKIKDKNDIILGKHGIYIKQGANRGTLLPQVAINQNWTVDEFLGNCSRYKAGIGWEGWKSADLYIYEAIVFDSDEVSVD